MALPGWNRWSWAAFALTAVPIAAIEWWLVLTAWDIVTYAQSYAAGHANAWGQDRAYAFVAQSMLVNYGSVIFLALIPVLVGWMASSVSQRIPSTRGGE